MNYLIKTIAIATLAIALAACNQKPTNENGEAVDPITYSKDKSASDESMKGTADDVPQSQYAFGDLPYDYDALEPVIDHKTMKLHYDKHHKGYYKKFLNAIEDTEASGKEVTEIFSQVSKYPVGVRNNGGGYYNHWLFWNSISPEMEQQPNAKLMQALQKSFGSYNDFMLEFTEAAASQFGSGWAWLIVKEDGSLAVTNTSNQDNPLMDVAEMQGMPILALDVWEHAYYVKYNNKRTKYIENFWKIVDWEKVNMRYQNALKGEVFMP